jgi:hypothetical protein
MLKLRKEHLDAFEAQVVNLFIGRVITHVKALWPADCAQLGDPAVKDLVRSGIQRAASLGLTSEYDMVRFIDLSFILVKDFETNPLSGWTRAILADRKLDPSSRIDKLYQRMEEEFVVIEKRKGPKA